MPRRHRFAPRAEALEGRDLPSTGGMALAAQAASPRAAAIVRLGGRSGPSATISGVLRAGRPGFYRFVARGLNTIDLTLQGDPRDGAAADVFLAPGRRAVAHIGTASQAPHEVSAGRFGARSVSVLVRVTGTGPFAIVAS